MRAIIIKGLRAVSDFEYEFQMALLKPAGWLARELKRSF